MILGELLTDLNVTHFDDDMTARLLQMIGILHLYFTKPV